MISKLKEAIAISQPIHLALKDLKINSNNNEFLTQQQISNRLRLFFETDETKKSFLSSLWDIVRKIFSLEGNFLKKIKTLLLIHIIISSQVARAELSKILISKQIALNSKPITHEDQALSQVFQNYYFYIYKLASQTTFINEEIRQEDLIIYFTLSNQSHLAISMQFVIEKVSDFGNNPLMANIAKFLYYDLQDIYIFILKDVKSMIEENTKKNKSEILELYKECQVLQQKMLAFYQFNRNFPHFSQMMPPHSLQINVKSLQIFEESKLIQQSLTQLSQLEEFSPKQQPMTSKHKQGLQFNFQVKKLESQTPDYTFSD